MKVYDRLVRAKMAKGYTPGEDGTPLHADEVDDVIEALKPSPVDYPVWAGSLLKAVKDLKDSPDTQVRLWAKAYELGLKRSGGGVRESHPSGSAALQGPGAVPGEGLLSAAGRGGSAVREGDPYRGETRPGRQGLGRDLTTSASPGRSRSTE